MRYEIVVVFKGSWERSWMEKRGLSVKGRTEQGWQSIAAGWEIKTEERDEGPAVDNDGNKKKVAKKSTENIS